MSKLPLFALSVAALVTLGASGCAAETDLEGGEEDVGETDDALRRGTSGVAGRLLDAQEIAELLRDAGFPESIIPEMVCTAYYESGWRDRSWNARNSNGTTDRGLFQINSVHLKRGELCAGITAEQLWNPATNVKCAKKIWDAQSITAWYGYRAHRTTKTENGVRRLGCDVYRLDDEIDTRVR